jgi:2-(1,2-epoxy-1,2-dihydrophenyl)acetyl-CoA isomerase
MEYEGLELQKGGNLAMIILNRQDKLNAINKVMIEESFPQVINELSQDKEVRAIILSGAGHVFCSGIDLQDALSLAETKLNIREVLLKSMKSLVLPFQKLAKPIIAAINGPAVGLGVTLASYCDIRIASDKATFSLAFVNRGIVPDCGSTYFLPRLLGLSQALRLMFTGDVFDVREAERIGLVSQVVPHEELMNKARGLAEKIARQPPITVSLIKQAAYQGINNSLEQQLGFESYANEISMKSEDFQEGVKAFLEKREAVFRGV